MGRRSQLLSLVDVLEPLFEEEQARAVEAKGRRVRVTDIQALEHIAREQK